MRIELRRDWPEVVIGKGRQEEVTQQVKQELQFVFVERVDEGLKAALENSNKTDVSR